MAGALSAQQEGDDKGVTVPQVSELLGEIEAAMELGSPSITVGVGGRRPSAPASQEAMNAAEAKLQKEEEPKGRGRASRNKSSGGGSSSGSGGGSGSGGAAGEEGEPPKASEVEAVVAALGRAQRERTSRFIQVRERGQPSDPWDPLERPPA